MAESIDCCIVDYNMVDLQHTFALRASMDGTRMDEIAAFLAVVEAGSFTSAARVLGRDASIISRRVSALETNRGVRLLERSTRHVSPTGAGVRFYERMRAATAAMKDAEAEATGTSGSVTGKLRLALPATFGRLWMAPLLPEFLAAHPDWRSKRNTPIAMSISSRRVSMLPSALANWATARWWQNGSRATDG
jgi:DNA-binding transcriptional LysR family regulator